MAYSPTHNITTLRTYFIADFERVFFERRLEDVPAEEYDVFSTRWCALVVPSKSRGSPLPLELFFAAWYTLYASYCALEGVPVVVPTG